MTEPAMIRRVAAAQATLNEFRDRPFRWGHSDCARLAASHLRRLGYKVRLPAKGRYGTPRSALKALRDRGFENLGEALDAVGLKRIAPLDAAAGDIVQGASGDAFGALGVALGNGRLIGYHEHASGAAVLQQLDLVCAWRV